MNILSLLQQILGPSVQKKDEHLFNCPFCHHHKKKLSINVNTNKWKCWVCGARGGHILWLLKKLNVAKEVLLQFKELLGDIDIKKYKETDVDVKLFLPHEYKPLWKIQKSYPYLHAVKYLKDRGLRTEDVLRYRIGYCETGNYAGRIIIPSYDKDNQLNYFIARTFYENGLKYTNPPVSKNVVGFENLISWNEPVILVEGFFDAISVRRNAIPLLGKTLPKKLERALVENKARQVVVFLDNDARMDALNIQQKLSQYGIDVKIVFPDEYDAADLGFEGSWEYIDGAKNIEFKDLIGQKLQRI
jgi:DNA primase